MEANKVKEMMDLAENVANQVRDGKRFSTGYRGFPSGQTVTVKNRMAFSGLKLQSLRATFRCLSASAHLAPILAH